MKKTIFTAIALSLSFFQTAQAEDLWQVMQQALNNDAQLQQSHAQELSKQQQPDISRANLLPNLSGNGQYNRENDASVNGISTSTKSYGLNLKQPIFHAQDWLNYRADKTNATAANFSYQYTLQDLISRTTLAYFDILQSENDLQLAENNRQAFQEKLNIIRKRFNDGLVKTVDVDTAQAALDESNADVLKNQIDIATKQATLQAITNTSYDHLKKFPATLPLMAIDANTLKQWQTDILQHNPQILADKTTAKADKTIINAQRAGHMPYLDASANYQYSKNNSLDYAAGRNTTVGLTLTVPIFSGGAVNAQTRQAAYNYQAQLGQLAIDYRAATQQLQSSFAAIVNDEARLKNDATTINSYQHALKSTQLAYQAGLSNTSISNLIDAQNNLYRSQLNLISDEEDYLDNYIKARAAAGLLNLDDVRMINHWLQ